MRGQNVSNLLLGNLVVNMNEHIASFSYKVTYYTLKEYFYLRSTLNVKIIYGLFKNKFPDHKIS